MTYYDEIGLIHDIDTTDPENPVATPLPGWHVNTTEIIPEWEQYQVTPETPRQVFAGLPTVCYRFPDEQVYREVHPEPEDIDA